MRIPDWFIYILALGVVLFVFLPDNDDAMAPETPPIEMPVPGEGQPLGEPSVFDPNILIQASEPMDGIGTAFTVSSTGAWVTARHVVEGCDDIMLELRPGTLVPARLERLPDTPENRRVGQSDLALLRTPGAPAGLPVNPSEDLRIGSRGFHVGYPQGLPGEAASKLLSRSQLITRGRRSAKESVLAWAEQGRTQGINGSLGGMSGGPVLNEAGDVVGVTVAESPRRGRLYSSAPSTVSEFLDAHGVYRDPKPSRIRFELEDYWTSADDLRDDYLIVKVVCDVED